MPKHLVLGNGNILICLDKYAQVRDFYYPHVGMENHVEMHRHKIGVFVDNKFSWSFDGTWDIDIRYIKETLVSFITLKNQNLRVEIVIEATVHPSRNIFIQKLTVKNLENREREIKVFFNQHFHVAGANVGDTVYYEPYSKSIIYYKGKRYFLINGNANGKGFSDYATGVADFQNMEGTYRDAEEGVLSKNPIEHGSVDSTIGFNLNIKPNSSSFFYYWIVVGTKFREVKELNEFVRNKKPEKLLNESAVHWKNWVNSKKIDFADLDKYVVDLFKTSLLVMRTHIDDNGAIIASGDSDIMHFKKDTYAYMWARDSAYVAMALDKVGYRDITKKFFMFINQVLTDEGFLLPKYRPDKAAGSSWHPWIRNNKIQLPIQEDETAIVLIALKNYYDQYKDLNFIRLLYPSLIKKSADFMCSFINKNTKLPRQSYDLWEEKLGTSTYTSASTYAALKAANFFSKLLKKRKDAKRYILVAEKIKKSLAKYLYDYEKNYFIKSIYKEQSNIFKKDLTVDISSGYSLFSFGILDIDDPKLTGTYQAIKDRLICKTEIGGLARHEFDFYQKANNNLPGNPWFITTLWLAEYYIAKSKTKDELRKVQDIFKWVVKHALPSGILGEQINPYTGETISVSPLTWSHGQFVLTVMNYLEKYKELSKNKS